MFLNKPRGPRTHEEVRGFLNLYHFMSYKFLFRFAKTTDMIYISHLDLMRLFARAARRADLMLSLTKGFNPHPKIKLKRALKLGVASPDEVGELALDESIGEDELRSRLQEQLPKGIQLIEVKQKDFA